MSPVKARLLVHNPGHMLSRFYGPCLSHQRPVVLPGLIFIVDPLKSPLGAMTQ